LSATFSALSGAENAENVTLDGVVRSSGT
jgi:hypothetical protein